jgi:hypothetical protein
LRSYHHLLSENKSLGTRDEFINRMSAQFGTRDIKITVQQELLKLWTAGAANGDFITYTERYRTAAHIAKGYSDETHITNLKQVVPQSILNGMIAHEVSPDPKHKLVLKDWSEYLNMLVCIYKFMNPDKVKGTLFKGSSHRDPDAMDTSAAVKGQKEKGKCRRTLRRKRIARGVKPTENNGPTRTTRKTVESNIRSLLLQQKAPLRLNHSWQLMRPDQDKRKSNTKTMGITKSVKLKKQNASSYWKNLPN